jgi:hypothetical protein
MGEGVRFYSSKGLGSDGFAMAMAAVLEFLNKLWGLGTKLEYGCCTGPPGYTHRAELVSLEWILGLLQSF